MHEPAEDAVEATAAPSTYVYGVVRAGHPLAPERLEGVGDPPGEVGVIRAAAVAAIVSGVAASPGVRATRRNLMAHLQVLQDALGEGPVLPMRFGVVFPDAEAVRRELLEPRAGELVRLLDEVDGAVQLNVKAFYDHDVLLREIVVEDGEIAALRERTRTLPADASYFDRIRLGELVAEAIAAARQRDSDSILERLRPLAVGCRTDHEVGERVAFKGAFLVARPAVDRFDATVAELAAALAPRVTFKAVGPVPPHDFVELDTRVPPAALGV